MRTLFTLFLAITVMGCSVSKEDEMVFGRSKKDEIHKGSFGSCCKDLAHCMSQPNSMIKASDEGILYMTIGYVKTEKGTGWFDHAVIFCPFCGKKLQDKDALAEKAKGK